MGVAKIRKRGAALKEKKERNYVIKKRKKRRLEYGSWPRAAVS